MMKDIISDTSLYLVLWQASEEDYIGMSLFYFHSQ